MLENKLAFRITCVAALLSFIVILLGVTTRLKDAGLGCPDWPGCYGKLIVPHQSSAAFAEKTLNPKKAWLEMIHRYAAAALALLSFAAITLTLHKRKLPQQPVKIAFLILILLFFQALLGKWTVTLHLHPLIVMLHLLGGLSLLSLLCLLLIGLIPFFSDPPNDNEKKLRLWSRIGLLLIIIQIMLGGWTSSNYAAFVCPDFPRCQGEWWPSMNFIEGFHLWTDSNRNFEGGLLSNNARTAIQMCHRVGALITTTYLIFLSWKLRTTSRKKILHILSTLIMLFLILQVSLGIINVIYLLPLPIAIAHNGFAALLLLLLITLNRYISQNFSRKLSVKS